MKQEKLTLEEIEKALNTLQQFSTLLAKYESMVRRISYQLRRFETTSSSFSFTPENIMKMLLGSGMIKLPQHLQQQVDLEDISLTDKEAEKIVKKVKKRKK